MLNDMPMKISTQLPNAALRFVLVISLFATPLDVIAAPVSIMTFNVEQVFDVKGHDADRCRYDFKRGCKERKNENKA